MLHVCHLLIATNMALTEGKARPFWSLYDQYQQGLADPAAKP